MTSVSLSHRPQSSSRAIFYSFLAATLVEAVVLTAIAWRGHWFSHPQAPLPDHERYVEAQIYEVPQEAKLTAPNPTVSRPEPTLSKVPGKGRPSKAHDNLNEHNRTEAPTGPDLGATHGPVAVFNPSPVLPEYLRGQELNTSVVIEFLITGLGVVTPRLLYSSGNDELDAIALSTVRKWQFRPAEQEHKPVDSKIRLRIVFEVK